jgi:hypothetical protein
VVIEACWNWGKIHDLPETLPQVVEIAVANPIKTHLIASAQIKTDKIVGWFFDANALRRIPTPRKRTPTRKKTTRRAQKSMQWAGNHTLAEGV